MKTYDISSDIGACEAFQIDNVYIGSKKIASILERIRDVTNIRIRTPFSREADVRVRFVYKGRECMVLEPFGDNSRYWIGPEDAENNELNLSEIRAAFDQYKPSKFARILGDLVSWNFKSLLGLK